MRPTRFVILSWLVLSAVISAPGRATDDIDLKILHKRYDSATRQLSYELWNDSARTVTAWRLSLARGDAHGHANNSILDQDLFERPATIGDGSGIGPLAPGESRVERWRLDLASQEPRPRALSLSVVVAVFDDLDWQGDPTAAGVILESRAARVQEIGRVVEWLEDNGSAPRSRELWSADLEARAEQLRSESRSSEIDAGLRREVAAQLSATRLELAEWLDGASREILLAPNPAASLRQMRLDIERRYELGLASVPAVATAFAVESVRGEHP